MQVLIVDKSAEHCRKISDALTELYGNSIHMAHEVHNAHAALSVMRTFPIDTIITEEDVCLGEEGPKLVFTLKAQGNTTPVVLMRGKFSQDDSTEKLIARYNIPVISTTFTLSELKTALQKAWITQDT